MIAGEAAWCWWQCLASDGKWQHPAPPVASQSTPVGRDTEDHHLEEPQVQARSALNRIFKLERQPKKSSVLLLSLGLNGLQSFKHYKILSHVITPRVYALSAK